MSTRADFDPVLNGRVAMVTGAARGLGRVISERLGKAGMRVALIGRTVESVGPAAAAVERAGGVALEMGADVTDARQVEEAALEVENTFGGVDLLVNNAGRYRALGPIWEADPEEWWGDVEGNVRGAFLPLRYVMPGMISSGCGRVINLASAAVAGPRPNGSAYAAAKAAVIHLTESVALSVREHGVKVFSLHPGPVVTPMSTFLLESEAGKRWMPEYRAIYLEQALHPGRTADLIVRVARGELDRLTGGFLDVRDEPGGAYSLRLVTQGEGASSSGGTTRRG